MGIKIGIIFSILLLGTSYSLVFAEETGSIVANTDKPSYETGEMLLFSGQVKEKKMPLLALRVYDPYGIILTASNVEIGEDNSFSKIIYLDSPFYDEAGTYTIKINYGKLESKLTFDIFNDEILDEPIFIDYDEPPTFEIIALVSEKHVYTDKDTITITGLVSAIDEPSVLIGIHDPFGMPTGFYFGEINSSNEFSISFLVKEDVNFKIEGTYSAIAHYGDSKDVVYFDFVKSIENESQTEIKEESVNNEIFENDIEEAEIEDPIPEPKTMDEPLFDEPKINKDVKNEKSNDEKNNNPEFSSEKQNKINAEEPTKQISEKLSKTANNLTVEDIELGILLNKIFLNCDKTQYVDLISYYGGMGPALIRLCKFGEAISYFDMELAKDSKNVEILTNKGSALARLGQYDEAILHYNLALKIDPSYVPALNNKANALSTLGKSDEAISVYSAAIKIDPQNVILKENFEKSNTKINSIKPNHGEISENLSFHKINGNLKNSHETQTGSTMKPLGFFEQIGNVFSSIGRIFGFIT